ncbi:hypothetical protein JRY53_001291 [Neisseria gonorrhoeae]|nr:hypothetical protein [Neisseria gonorrhoeae]
MSLSAENRTFYLVETGEIGFGSSALFISQSLEEAEAVVADFFKGDEKLHYETESARDQSWHGRASRGGIYSFFAEGAVFLD